MKDSQSIYVQQQSSGIPVLILLSSDIVLTDDDEVVHNPESNIHESDPSFNSTSAQAESDPLPSKRAKYVHTGTK